MSSGEAYGLPFGKSRQVFHRSRPCRNYTLYWIMKKIEYDDRKVQQTSRGQYYDTTIKLKCKNFHDETHYLCGPLT
jgi:hypothetical protein